VVSSFENDPGTKGVETALSFEYRTLTLKDPTQQGPNNTFSWDRVTNSEAGAGAVTSAASVSAAGTSGSDPVTAVAVPTSSPLHYFLKIDGVTGDSTDKDHKGWFAVDGYDIEATTPTSIGSSSGGAGAGKATFSPLAVDVHSLTGVASLLGDTAKGSSIKSMELVGVNANDQTVYDLKLTDALVASFHNDPGVHGVETELSFDYKGLSLTDHPINSNGSLGKAETFSFDLTKDNTTSILSNFMAASGGSGPLVTSLTHQDNPWLT
jgi:type VI protein secretion system component Hcp